MNHSPTQANCPTPGPFIAACATVHLPSRDVAPQDCSCSAPPITVPTSSHLACCGDDVLVFCPQRWIGPRPAKVLSAAIDDGAQFADVNILFHGDRDAALLAAVRRSPKGGTWTTLPVYASLDEASRLYLASSGVGTWAEFKPKRIA